MGNQNSTLLHTPFRTFSRKTVKFKIGGISTLSYFGSGSAQRREKSPLPKKAGHSCSSGFGGISPFGRKDAALSCLNETLHLPRSALLIFPLFHAIIKEIVLFLSPLKDTGFCNDRYPTVPFFERFTKAGSPASR